MSAEVVRDNDFHARVGRSGDISNDFDLSSGSMPYLTQQYALPIHHASLRRDSSDASPSSGEQTPRAENTLRRKTPNGTLNAGYRTPTSINCYRCAKPTCRNMSPARQVTPIVLSYNTNSGNMGSPVDGTVRQGRSGVDRSIFPHLQAPSQRWIRC